MDVVLKQYVNMASCYLFLGSEINRIFVIQKNNNNKNYECTEF